MQWIPLVEGVMLKIQSEISCRGVLGYVTATDPRPMDGQSRFPYDVVETRAWAYSGQKVSVVPIPVGLYVLDRVERGWSEPQPCSRWWR